MRACPEAGAGLTGAHQNVVMPTLTGCLLLLPFIPWKFSAAWAGPFAGKPAPTTVTDSWIEAVVGAGSPAKGPALLANLHPPFTVAATTVLAGKPALVDTHWGLDTGRCGVFPRKDPSRQTYQKSLAAGSYPNIVLSSRKVETRGGSGTIRSSPQTELRPKVAQTIGESAIKANNCAAISPIPNSIQSQFASVNRLLAFPSLSPALKLMPFCMNTRMISQAA